jgi:hypothetical protein
MTMNPIDPLTPLERLVFGDDAVRGSDGVPLETGFGSEHHDAALRAAAAREAAAASRNIEPAPTVPRFIDVRTREPDATAPCAAVTTGA